MASTTIAKLINTALATAGLILISWSSKALSQQSLMVSDLSVTLMTLNVQNLFDNQDDPGKDDKAYLPISAKQGNAHKNACAEIKNRNWRKECLTLDWSDAAVDHKLSVLAEVIRQVNKGQGPEIIALQEVENEYILERLRTEYLSGLGYEASILVEGTDNRGIDVAFLSKLTLLGKPKLHPLALNRPGRGSKDVRGILEARFIMPDGSMLTGYNVHFPAPFHPTDMRIAAYQHLQTLRDSHSAGELIFAAGDFNTTSTEDQREKLLDKMVRPHWLIAHEDCAACPGTYYYAPEDNWSFLDMILVSGTQSASATWEIAKGSVRLANTLPQQTTHAGTPARYRAATGEGVSDHWPLILTMEKR